LPYETELLQVTSFLSGRGIALIRATLLRALLFSAAFACFLVPARCLGEDANQLPEKATKELSPELLSLIYQRKMPKHSPIILRIFKEEAELEVWKQDTTGHFQILSRAILGRNCMRATVRRQRAFIQLRPS
jgi:murein L,D-transpeptidase YafK